MSIKLSVDFETRSPVDIRTRGAFVYFEHPRTEVLMAAYRIDGGELKLWTFRDSEPPRDLWAAIEDGARISAWNCQFEALGFNLLADRCGWPRPHYDQFVDTAAAAAAMSLPRALGDAAAALGTQAQKDKDGMRLIRKFSIPRRDGSWNEPEQHPEDWAKFCSYCMDDVRTEEDIARRLVPLSDAEQQVWLLTERINRRGVRIDVRSARSALTLADKAKAALDREMRLATGGYVGKCSEVAKLVEWVQSQGVELTSAAKNDIVDLLECDDLPAAVRKALELRQEAAKTSVSKLAAMLTRANHDARARGGFIYHAAGTGRTQSVGVNWNNLPRPRKIYDDEKPRTDVLFQAFRSEDPELLAFLYPQEPRPPAPELAKYLVPTQDGRLGRALHLVSDAIRGFIWAAPGHDLVQADFSNIEGNVIAWTAGEEWKVEAIRDLIADPLLPDMYRRTAAAILNTTTDVITKKHPLRQGVGKPAELGLSYGGGVMAFVTFAKNYGVRLDPLYEPVWAAADEERRGKAVKRYESQAKRGLSGTAILSRNAWIACEVVKLGWRAQNAAIAQSWKDLETAVRNAVTFVSPEREAFRYENAGHPDVKESRGIFSAGKVDYLVAKGFLWARLPSGRCLAYGAPRLKAQVWAKIKLPDGSWSEAEVMERDKAEAMELRGEAKIEGSTSDKVTVLGVDSQTKKWRRYGLYGGLLAENNTQAIARDLLVNGMRKAEAAGYPIIATVYDEIIAERRRGEADIREFERLICELPAWADGLPLTAGGFIAKRYKKD